MPSLNTGNAILSNPIKVDSSYNVGIGGAASGSYKLQVTGTTNLTGALTGTSATFSGSVTSDDLILTAGTLFGAGNTGFSNRSSDTTLYLQMPATGFNITDNALNTRFILSSTGAATFSNQVTINGPSADWAAVIQNTNSTSGTSYGLKVKAGTSGASDATFVLQDYAGNEFFTARGNGRIGIENSAPQGKLEVGRTASNTTAGGHFFSTFIVPVNTWTTVFYAPNNNWAAITEFTWTSGGDYNRSGAAYMRWAYNTGSASLGVVYTLFNNDQNAAAQFRNSGGEIQIYITGGAVAYNVQVRIQGSQAA